MLEPLTGQRRESVALVDDSRRLVEPRDREWSRGRDSEKIVVNTTEPEPYRTTVPSKRSSKTGVGVLAME